MNKTPAEIVPVSNQAPTSPIRVFFSLVYLRKRHNMTQTELAEKLDLTQSGLSHIESGRRQPNPELLRKIGEVFDCDVDSLEIEPWTVEMAKQMIAEDIASLYYGHGELCHSKDDRQFLLQVVRTLTPQVLVEEKVTTTTDDQGNRMREKVERKLAQHGINLKEK